MYNDSLFNAFARSFEARSQTDMSMAEYLESCRGDPMRYANAAERLLAAIGEPTMIDTAKEPRLGRIFLNRTMRTYPAFAGFHGMEETIERIVGFFRHAAQGLEERKQILYLLGPVGGGKSSLAERLKSLMEVHPIYVLKAGDELSPVFESPLSLFDPETLGPMIEEKYGIPRRRLNGLMSPWCYKRLEAFGGDISQFRVAQDPALAAAADRDREDRARRREQPGHLLAGRQGRHPQARNLRAERSRCLQLFRRPQPRQPGHARIRRDVQGADQDAASAADRDAGRQLHRHREYRRDPVHRRHSRALQRIGVAELQDQQEQRSLHRPHLRHQGAVLPARHRRAEDLREADLGIGACDRALRAGDAGDAGALLGDVAAAQARELDGVCQDAGL